MRPVGRITYGATLTLEAIARAFVLFVDEVRSAVNPVVQKPILDGVLLKSVSLTAGVGLQIPHGLGRKPIGYIVTRGVGVYPQVYDWFTITSDHDDKFLYVASSATCTADLWVF